MSVTDLIQHHIIMLNKCNPSSFVTPKSAQCESPLRLKTIYSLPLQPHFPAPYRLIRHIIKRRSLNTLFPKEASQDSLQDHSSHRRAMMAPLRLSRILIQLGVVLKPNSPLRILVDFPDQFPYCSQTLPCLDCCVHGRSYCAASMGS